MKLQNIAQELVFRSTVTIYIALFCSLAACHIRKNWPKAKDDWIWLPEDWTPKISFRQWHRAAPNIPLTYSDEEDLWTESTSKQQILQDPYFIYLIVSCSILRAHPAWLEGKGQGCDGLSAFVAGAWTLFSLALPICKITELTDLQDRWYHTSL